MDPSLRNTEIVTLGVGGADVAAEIHEQSFPIDTGERWSRKDIRQILQLPGSLCLIASRSSDPVGYALARFVLDECELLSLGVLKNARRTGVARSLVNELARICQQRSVRCLFLEVREDNEGAKRFYEKHGFREYGRRKDYYRTSSGILKNAITMAYNFST